LENIHVGVGLLCKIPTAYSRMHRRMIKCYSLLKDLSNLFCDVHC